MSRGGSTCCSPAEDDLEIDFLPGLAGAVRGKKILLLMTSLTGGGADRVTLNLAADWSGAGAEVVVATLAADDGDAYPIPAGVRRVALNLSGRSYSLLSMLRNNVAPVVKLRRMLRAERPDIAVGMATVSAVALALARCGDMIAVGSERVYPGKEPLGRVWDVLQRHCYRRLDAIVAQASEGADRLRVRTNARRVVVIPNAVALPLPQGEPRIAVRDVVAPGRRILLAAGRLTGQKGFDRLLDGFAQVAPRHPDWRLVVLGKGALRGALQAQAERLGVGGLVHFPGHAGNAAEWYRAADAFVLSSRYEGFPNVLLEAMAHGCAVIGTDCNTGPRDIIRDGEDGLLVPQDDAAALAAGLDRLLGDEALRHRLASRAGEVCERFSPERIRGMWWSLFDELKRCPA